MAVHIIPRVLLLDPPCAKNVTFFNQTYVLTQGTEITEDVRDGDHTLNERSHTYLHLYVNLGCQVRYFAATLQG